MTALLISQNVAGEPIRWERSRQAARRSDRTNQVASAGLQDEDVTHAVHRLDRLRSLRVLLDLAAQAGDPDIDAAVERLVTTPMREFEQPVAGQHAVGITEEHLHKAEL